MQAFIHLFTKNICWVHNRHAVHDGSWKNNREWDKFIPYYRGRDSSGIFWMKLQISIFFHSWWKIKTQKLPCHYEESRTVVIPDVLIWLWRFYLVYYNDSFIHPAEWLSLLPVSSRSMSTGPQELKFHGERTDTMIQFKNICALLCNKRF